MIERVFILDGVRLPLGKPNGRWGHLDASGLAASAMQALLQRPACRDMISRPDQVILGNAVGQGGNFARKAVLEAGLPESTPAFVVDGQCTSGLIAITMAAARIATGLDGLVWAGGSESCSKEKVYRPRRASFAPLEIGDPEMGEAAEDAAIRYNVTREEQDEYALISHRQAAAASAEGFFQVMLPQETAEQDETLHRSMNEPLMNRLRPAFAPDGTITAGNAAPRADGACILALVPESKIELENQTIAPLGEYLDGVLSGCSPNQPGLAVIPAIRRLLKRNRMSASEIDCWQINEPFAVYNLICIRELGIDRARVNLSGGAIAFGHPFAATGAMMTLHLLHELQKSRGRYGIVAAAAGGGMGVACLWKNPQAS